MPLVLILSAVGITVVALRILFALKTAHVDVLRVRKRREKRSQFPPILVVLFRAQMLAAAQVQKLQ